MKGLLILSDACEDTEALSTRALLKRAQIHVDTVTINPSKQITTAFGLQVLVDYHSDEIDLDDYDFLIVPGGRYVAQIIDHDTYIKSTVKAFERNQKLICAICAGPRFLGVMGVLKHKHYTIYPGNQNDAFEGVYHPELKAITDGLVITARGAGATIDFAYEIIKYIQGEEAAKKILFNIAY